MSLRHLLALSEGVLPDDVQREIARMAHEYADHAQGSKKRVSLEGDALERAIKAYFTERTTGEGENEKPVKVSAKEQQVLSKYMTELTAAVTVIIS